MGWWNKASGISVQGGSLPWGSLPQWGTWLASHWASWADKWPSKGHLQSNTDMSYLPVFSFKEIFGYLLLSFSVLCVASSWWHYNKTFWVQIGICIGWINKSLLYSTGSYIQYPVIKHHGKEYEKEHTHTHTHMYNWITLIYTGN